MKRSDEKGEPRPLLDRKADAFDEQGMVRFFRIQAAKVATGDSAEPAARDAPVDR